MQQSGCVEQGCEHSCQSRVCVDFRALALGCGSFRCRKDNPSLALSLNPRLPSALPLLDCPPTLPSILIHISGRPSPTPGPLCTCLFVLFLCLFYYIHSRWELESALIGLCVPVCENKMIRKLAWTHFRNSAGNSDYCALIMTSVVCRWGWWCPGIPVDTDHGKRSLSYSLGLVLPPLLDCLLDKQLHQRLSLHVKLAVCSPHPPNIGNFQDSFSLNFSLTLSVFFLPCFSPTNPQ